MLESYVTPLLMSYVNKYIKNLKPSDLQLSLWGGDVVLSKLDLRLDVLEQVLYQFLSNYSLTHLKCKIIFLFFNNIAPNNFLTPGNHRGINSNMFHCDR